MTLIDDFDSFLREEINLNPTRLNILDERVRAITEFLRESGIFKDHFLDVIPQGSFAHKTIIKPVREHDEFDADVLFYIVPFDEWTPGDYVEQLYELFLSSGVYRDKVILGKRCVTIDYASDFHIDVVPYMERNGFKYITYRPDAEALKAGKTARFELTDPETYNAWLDEKDAIASRHLIKVIRLVKYLRDYKNTFNVKSVVFNVLIGSHVNEAAVLENPGCYADVPTTLRTVLTRLSGYVQANERLPSIMDPSATGENFSDRWTQEEWARFRTALIRYAEWVDDAWMETDPQSSRRKWQRVFGNEFGSSSSTSISKSGGLSRATFTNSEQYLSDLNIPLHINPNYKFRIRGKVMKRDKMGAYILHTRGNYVLPGREIKFEIEQCNVREPFTIYWKVLNRGEEAERRNCIRGTIEVGGRTWKRLEPTAFRGSHVVECYIVKGGVCVAKHRQPVNVGSPASGNQQDT